MILQRLATSIRKQDWFTVLIETLIVVFGVFIGLQVNNWNEAQVERQDERGLVAQLSASMETAMAAKQTWIDTLDARNRLLAEGILLVQDAADSVLPAAACKELWMVHILDTTAETATLNALLSSERLDLIGDLALQAQLLALRDEAFRTQHATDRLIDQLVNLVDNHADAFPRRLVDPETAESGVVCERSVIAGSQVIRNRLLSNLGRRQAIIMVEQEGLARLATAKEAIDAYSP